MYFELLSAPIFVERIAVGSRVRDIRRLRRLWGPGRWRKLKGPARIRLLNQRVFWAEVHWYEADRIGRRELKIKRPIFEER